jgi:hypothetical protein
MKKSFYKLLLRFIYNLYVEQDNEYQGVGKILFLNRKN